ncbi:unnamed protein product [Acanthoscelides obtectus]|uniref:Uncharacterized protein n=1 Tax=Acanthoscelides obtectus TaxID=200917 RepID=A0A9P0LYF6_ACAOB|nr:unnamed protein product [Acanthoscelides obtectus]CAK1663850.1 hypothetical protein AOBTE_LOCUS23895 [Acanthoscelides obtectus]
MRSYRWNCGFILPFCFPITFIEHQTHVIKNTVGDGRRKEKCRIENLTTPYCRGE